MKGSEKLRDLQLSTIDLTHLDTMFVLAQEHSKLLLLLANTMMSVQAEELAGTKSSQRKTEKYGRYGYNPTTIRVGKERIKTEVPRLKNLETGEINNVPILSKLQNLPASDDETIRKMMSGISTRDYAGVASRFSESFGLSKSSVSRAFIEESAKALEAFETRKIEGTYVAMYVDGKYMAGSQILIAVGVNTEGQKIVLGFSESTGENAGAIAELFRNIVSRGFKYETGFLMIVDGGKGWHKAAREVFGSQVVIQRCVIHKIRNVIDRLPESERDAWKEKIKAAYHQVSYEEAKEQLLKLADELAPINRSASESLKQDLEEILTLHRLAIPKKLRASFYSTNPIESVNAELERRMKRVTNKNDSRMKQRWVAVSLLEIEKNLGKVRSHTQIHLLQEAVQQLVLSLNPKTNTH